MKILRRVLWDERMALLSWAIVLILLAVFAVSTFQSFGTAPGLNELMNQLPPYLGSIFGGLDFGTAEGYLNAELYSWLPLLIAFYTVLFGAASLSREVDSHTAESLLAQPVARRTVVIEKSLAMLVGTLFLSILTFAATILTLSLFVNSAVSARGFLLATVASFLTTAAVGALAVFISAVTNEQRKAAVYAAGALILLYFVNVIGQASSKLDFLSTMNPFGHYRSADIIRTGAMAWGDVAFLVGFTLVFLAAAVWWFDRKDIA